MKCSRPEFRSIVLVLLISTLTMVGWSQEKSAAPEFFGFYATDGGRLVALYEGQGAQPAIKSTEIYSVPKKSLFPSNLPQISPSSRFIVYYMNAGEMMQSITLHRMPFLRYVIEQADPAQAGYAVLGGARQPSEQVVATVGKPMLARVAELQYQLLAKPVPNQPQMVELVPRTPLAPGFYVASYGPAGKAGWHAWFAVASPDASDQPYCIDLVMMGGYGGMFFNANSELTQTAPLLTREHYRTCTMNQGTAAPGARVADNTPAVASCADYDSCIQHGVASFRSAAFGQALADFKKAAEHNPKMAIPWMWVGNTQLAMGQLQEFRAAWDKVLELKTPLPVPACREKSVQTCDMGDLQIGPENVAFLMKGQIIFDVPASQVNVRGTTVYRPGGITIPHISFGIDVGKKKYKFSVSPYGIGCNVHSILACPQQGMDQQAAISEYLEKTIAKIAGTSPGAGLQAAPATSKAAKSER